MRKIQPEFGEKKDIYTIYTSRLEVGTSVEGFIRVQKNHVEVLLYQFALLCF